MLEPRILALRILPNHNNINILMPSRQPRQIEAVDEGSIQIELPPELHIQGADASAHRRRQATLQADLVSADGFHDGRRDGGHVAMYSVEGLEVDRGVHRLHYLLDGVGDERSDAVSAYQGDSAWGSIAGAGHVGDRSTESKP